MTAPLPTEVESGPHPLPQDPANRLRSTLLRWFKKNQRSLPWRATRDPYGIWVSEIMLQQTRVVTAIDFYQRWMERFPTLLALAAADESDVLKSWEGLGYYSRARNLQAAARRVVHELGGHLPRTAEGLRALPGIGPYTAGAIASIAFDLPEPAIDGNVNRVITRVFCLPGDPLRSPTKAKVSQLVHSLLPKRGAGQFNQALMELGASHCSPRSPNCLDCPWHDPCQARREDRVMELPESRSRAAVTKEEHSLAIVRKREKFLVVRTPLTAQRWAGLWVFPSACLAPGQSGKQALHAHLTEHFNWVPTIGTPLMSLRHFVTRFDIALQVFEVQCPAETTGPVMPGTSQWCSRSKLRQLAMPAPHRKIEKQLRGTP